MRGAQPTHAVPPSAYRIIPADAGSTASDNAMASASSDHPRGCGEHKAEHFQTVILAGSSPRMRGARTVRDSNSSLMGIIPADAGSTLNPPTMPTTSPDHPRGCGEHEIVILCNGVGQGSSPRMRGAPPLLWCPRPVPRIIPADAGSTIWTYWVGSKSWDHPRGCGEHATALIHSG